MKTPSASPAFCNQFHVFESSWGSSLQTTLRCSAANLIPCHLLQQYLALVHRHGPPNLPELNAIEPPWRPQDSSFVCACGSSTSWRSAGAFQTRWCSSTCVPTPLTQRTRPPGATSGGRRMGPAKGLAPSLSQQVHSPAHCWPVASCPRVYQPVLPSCQHATMAPTLQERHPRAAALRTAA